MTPVKLVMGVLILAFAAIEMLPGTRRARFSPRWLPLGGAVSGFFGGLSGHQGAFRAAFLSSLDLPPRAFAGTQVVLACMVDAVRLLVYAAGAAATDALAEGAVRWDLVGAATIGAFAGSLAGTRLLPRVTSRLLRRLTGGLLLVVGCALAAGLA